MKKLTPLRAIRAKCLDCCCGQAAEVRLCTAEKCPLFPYRKGHRPKDDKIPTEKTKSRKPPLFPKEMKKERTLTMVERCCICGEIVPEGRQVCPNCEMENSLFCPCDGTKLKIIGTTGTGYIYRCPECGYILGGGLMFDSYRGWLIYPIKDGTSFEAVKEDETVVLESPTVEGIIALIDMRSGNGR